MRRLFAFALSVTLTACSTLPNPPPSPAPAPSSVEVQILAINDFHGNLEPPGVTIDATLPDGGIAKVAAGGIAYLAGAAKALRAGQRHSVTVSAGDMIGASPLVSALFLDEPTIAGMNLIGVDYNAVGNHEFDKGSAELLRMQRGGCAKHTTKVPCAIDPFRGADFRFLAANVVKADGTTLFPGTGIEDFGAVQVGFIGMTLKETAALVTPAGIAGLTFTDEAATANAAIPALKAAGADAIVLLIHQGGRTTGGYNDKSCPELSGEILPILDRLDPAIEVVVSGHTHAAYICERARAGGGRPLLLTSAGQYGTLITDLRLTVDPVLGLVARRADNVIVQGEEFRSAETDTLPVAAFARFAADPATSALVERYVSAARPQADRVVGRLSSAATKQPTPAGALVLGNLIADAQLGATRNPAKGGAQISFQNSGGVRADLIPAANGDVTYGQIFALQPFGNNLVVKTLTGAQLKSLLEQQFDSGRNSIDRPNILQPSAGFAFAYDLKRPAGQRVVSMTLDGKAVGPATHYRVTVPSFLASGGDNFTVFAQGADPVDAGLDLDALEAWLRPGRTLPVANRITDLTPKP